MTMLSLHFLILSSVFNSVFFSLVRELELYKRETKLQKQIHFKDWINRSRKQAFEKMHLNENIQLTPTPISEKLKIQLASLCEAQYSNKALKFARKLSY